jgi:MtN3 and saliva related transmembrane protein
VIENIIGWGSTLILIATLGAQIGKELASGKANNVSPWLFVGQCAASLGFLIYSVLVGSAVFIVSNALILVTALIGEGVRRWLVARDTRNR